MKRICAWCKKDMGEKPPLDDKSVTHGMCPKCFSELLKGGRNSYQVIKKGE